MVYSRNTVAQTITERRIYRGRKHLMSLSERHNLTELSVICIIAGEGEKTIQQPLCLIVIRQDQSLKVEMILLNCKVGGHDGSKFRASRITKIETVLCCVASIVFRQYNLNV